MEDILLKKPGFSFLIRLHFVDKLNIMTVIYLAFGNAFNLLSHSILIGCMQY